MDTGMDEAVETPTRARRRRVVGNNSVHHYASSSLASRLLLILLGGAILACLQFYNFHTSMADDNRQEVEAWKLHHHLELERELQALKGKYENAVHENDKLGVNMEVLKEKYVTLISRLQQTQHQGVDMEILKEKYVTLLSRLQEMEQEQSESPQEEEEDSPEEDYSPNEEYTRSTSNPPNILLLYGDDWRHDSFHAAGNDVIKTPVLDKLAKEGVMFTHNCVTTSICGISRATLQTGQYFSRHKCNPHLRDDESLPLFLDYWNETLNGLLRNAGYHVGFVGKWQILGLPFDDFDFVREYYGFHVDEDGNHITRLNERDSLDFLRDRPRDKPFFLTVSFFATHAVDGDPLQYVAQNKSLPLYRKTNIPVSPSATEESWQRLPDFFLDENEGRSRWRQRYATPEMYQHHMKNMYRMVTEVDSTSGKLLRELKRQKVLDNTVVIFTTDNGNLHSEHGLAEKWYPYQESIRVPLVIKDPRMPADKRGTTNDEFTLNIDLAPTIVSAAGVKPPKRMQGRDIADLYLEDSDKKKETWRKFFYYEHPEVDCDYCIPASEALVLKDSNKYVKYFSWTGHDKEQLFDLLSDPYEENDLAGNEERRVEFQAMKELFEKVKRQAQ